jgi:ABC-type sugar transport system permease subunit
MPGYNKDALTAVWVSLAVTTLALVMTFSRETLVVVVGSFLQGVTATLVHKRQMHDDSWIKALVRLAFLTPVITALLVYAVFRQTLLWPLLAACSSWSLGSAVFRLRSGLT